MSDETDPLPKPRPYWYYSGGGEVRFGIERFQGFGGSFALYHSVRHVSKGDPSDSPPTLLDGRGTTGLARVSWTHLAVPKLNEPQSSIRKSFGFSGFYGFGSGNKPKNAAVDEGYLGENAGYANDVIFLSGVAASTSFPDVGKGLSNKRYAGLQYTDGRWSPLAYITKALKAEDDIQSFSTVVAIHAYQLEQAIQGRHWAGTEADLTFNIEAPKNIQWVLGGAYYKRSTALNRLKLDHDIWSATAKLTLKLNSL
ncbi:MAG TPA: hypothetical protein VLB76_14160 [Thermoanaerobaculia bacterium]|jgi:hypothetical protein|nr:hypothetical protein [Thermoanaerobaculia bacterium]